MTKKQNNRVTHIRTRTRKKHTALLPNASANASGSSLSFKPFESELEALFKKKDNPFNIWIPCRLYSLKFKKECNVSHIEDVPYKL